MFDQLLPTSLLPFFSLNLVQRMVDFRILNVVWRLATQIPLETQMGAMMGSESYSQLTTELSQFPDECSFH